MPAELSPEDEKLVVLARAARARAGSAAGAAVRDVTGRTYSGADVTFADPLLNVSALRTALVLAVASGMRSFEVAVVVTEAQVISSDGVAALHELSPGCRLHLVAG